LPQKQAKFEGLCFENKKGRRDFCQKIESVSPFDDFFAPKEK
jgi:hypothetical protein